ncbi:MAG: FAD-binding oxidoreductase [Candidatus Omnitrophica bacterium CG12_big_fil_rev_8_21_14_0_65_42_8]|nr:MAG: FAD-binding oxidoreductase [Candidatus Omnitrophica bacterium CG12_big_fil_rev_8_21_14_0_65_42_8]
MIIKTDPDIIKGYFEDYSGLLGGYADRVILPENEKEARDILLEASAKKIPVTISGGGTGVTGARIPFGGWVISTERLNKIIGINGKTLTATLQPGVRLSDLENELSKKGLIYLPDPTEPNAFLGGTISTNASGAKGFKYGSTRNYVKRLKILLSTGDIIDIKRGDYFINRGMIFSLKLKNKEIKIKIPDYSMPEIKTAAGYYVKDCMDFLDLFIGHEGTLGFILETDMALSKRPEGVMSFFSFFSSEDDAISFVRDAKTCNAMSLEYMDENSLFLLRTKYPNIPKSAKGLIYFEQDYKKESEPRLIDSWTKLLEKHKALTEDSYFADSDRERAKLKELRHALPDAVNEIVKKNKMPKVGTDIAVPDAGFREMLKFYKEKLASSGIDYLIFGHIGESHMHVNMLPRTEGEFKKSREIYMEFAKKAVGMGGTVSAEHGIGKIKHHFLEIMYGKDNLKQMALLKKTLDPSCILGLDNIFPKELLE